MISFTEALKLVLAQVSPLPETPVGLGQAGGYYLAGDIGSDIDLPMTDNSAMDGYAVKSADTARASRHVPVRLQLIGTVPAGHPYNGRLEKGQALYIATGGTIPDGADAVVPVEETSQESEEIVHIFKEAHPSDHIRFAGEDVRKGETVLPQHSFLGPSQLGILASAGAARIRVFKRPEVAFLATGDELIETAGKPQPGQVRNSNAIVIGNLVKGLGCRFNDLGIAGDTGKALLDKLKGVTLPEVLVTSAGVSMGRYDIVADVLKSLGLEVLFWKVAIKPGKPLVFGKIGRTLYFGLPGNPVSADVVFRLFVEPALLRMAGAMNIIPVIFEAKIRDRIKATRGRLNFARGICWYDKGWHVKTTGRQGSHITSGMALANCLILTAPDQPAAPGDIVRVQMLEGLRTDPVAALKAFSEWLS
jgi:molybdopterin molybdotransferase